MTPALRTAGPAPALRPAREHDWPRIAALLRAAALPLDGAHAHLGNFVVGESASEIVCAGGLEIHGADALLRSVVVGQRHRGARIGAALTGHILALAGARGVTRVFLLTTTAAGYFETLGFVPASRDEVPEALGQSRQFQGACPASATLLRARLTP